MPGALRPQLQPIVDLASTEVVAFEALARWPGLAEADPAHAFAAARAEGRVAEVDRACQAAALSAVRGAGMDPGLTLFLNVEPAGLAPGSDAGPAPGLGRDGTRIVLELTERALTRSPSELLALVAWTRSRGLGIALDDVGADPASLALLPFVAPDVVKLDMSLVQQRTTRARAAIATAVMAHAERTGALVLAEGIETLEHLQQARALGATLGQGWMFGRPGPLPPTPAPTGGVALLPRPAADPPTPFDLVADDPRRRVGSVGTLLGLSHHIEAQGAALHPPPVLLGAFQHAARFTPATARRYSELASWSPLVGALGVGLGPEPAPGVRGAALDAGDPLAQEWTVVVVGPHYTGALIAREVEAADTGERRFAFLVTHDVDLVTAAARSLMARLVPAPPGAPAPEVP